MTLLDPVGAITKSSGETASANTFRFSTKQFESQVGIGWWGHRWYAPNQNRWLSRDPAGEEDGGINLYVTTANSPTDIVDPDGREFTYRRRHPPPDRLAGLMGATEPDNLLISMTVEHDASCPTYPECSTVSLKDEESMVTMNVLWWAVEEKYERHELEHVWDFYNKAFLAGKAYAKGKEQCCLRQAKADCWRTAIGTYAGPYYRAKAKHETIVERDLSRQKELTQAELQMYTELARAARVEKEQYEQALRQAEQACEAMP